MMPLVHDNTTEAKLMTSETTPAEMLANLREQGAIAPDDKFSVDLENALVQSLEKQQELIQHTESIHDRLYGWIQQKLA